MSTTTTAPYWRALTTEETAEHLAGHVVYHPVSCEPLEIRETAEGLEALDGTPAECGCIFHVTHQHPVWGFSCKTEEQPYCNHECPHTDEDDES